MVRIIIFLILLGLEMLTGCSIFKKAAGVDIDAEQFEAARRAKISRLKAESLQNLSARLSKTDPIDNADFCIQLSDDFLGKIVNQYEQTEGWLDANTNFSIKKINVAIEDGYASASLGMIAHNNKFNVELELITDCLVTLEMKNGELVLSLEPFNISPTATGKGVASLAEEIIENLVKINLAGLGSKLPEIKIPLGFSNSMNFPSTNFTIRDKVNLQLTRQMNTIDYKIKLKELLIFKGNIFIALNLESVKVR
ncbi:MAG: hypothetical protein HW421_62 [Ignavibacteria bacterium]|nr:hypothetical protein [Ignavibacteria bacterium]